jgi:hypothetical protein
MHDYDTDPSVFDKITEPVIRLIGDEADKIGGDAETYTLSFYPFTVAILYGIIMGIKSVSLLITEIRTSRDAKNAGLKEASKSMYSEAFSRYDILAYRHIFYTLLNKLNFLGIPEIRALGTIYLADGSVFPALISMRWASYKTKANAIKLHLFFELNRMIPVQFVSSSANTSEKGVLRQIAEAGITYICDRGYVCFDLFRDISRKGSHFIIRGKSNHTYNVTACFLINIPDSWKTCLQYVTDYMVVFENDRHRETYRMVSFTVSGEEFFLITSRYDLMTYQIIMLYAYRWQVELIFRFLKRTLNGIHLMSHSPNGVEIQFTLYMIAYLLLLSFRQECIKSEDNKDGDIVTFDFECDNNISEKNSSVTPFGGSKEGGAGDIVSRDGGLSERNSSVTPSDAPHYPCGLVTLLGKKLKKYWRIGIHWLTTVRNLISEPFTPEILKIINSMQ